MPLFVRFVVIRSFQKPLLLKRLFKQVYATSWKEINFQYQLSLVQILSRVRPRLFSYILAGMYPLSLLPQLLADSNGVETKAGKVICYLLYSVTFVIILLLM